VPLLAVYQSPAVCIWKITETWQEMLDMFQDKTLFADDICNTQSDNRKCERLAVRLLVKRLTGVEMMVHYQENGAPFLANNPFYIGISHTKGFAAVILSKQARPGIDIEYRSERAWKLRAKFLNAQELAFFDLFPSTQQATVVTLGWCAKETAYKTLQESGVDFINHLHITPFTLADKGRILLKETKTPDQETYQIHYQITDDFILTWKE